MKTIDLKITLEFDEEVNENASEKIMNNIERAIVNERDSCGLVPDDCETFTKQITVTKLEPAKTHYLVVKIISYFTFGDIIEETHTYHLFPSNELAVEFTEKDFQKTKLELEDSDTTVIIEWDQKIETKNSVDIGYDIINMGE